MDQLAQRNVSRASWPFSRGLSHFFVRRELLAAGAAVVHFSRMDKCLRQPRAHAAGGSGSRLNDVKVGEIVVYANRVAQSEAVQVVPIVTIVDIVFGLR